MDEQERAGVDTMVKRLARFTRSDADPDRPDQTAVGKVRPTRRATARAAGRRAVRAVDARLDALAQRKGVNEVAYGVIVAGSVASGALVWLMVTGGEAEPVRQAQPKPTATVTEVRRVEPTKQPDPGGAAPGPTRRTEPVAAVEPVEPTPSSSPTTKPTERVDPAPTDSTESADPPPSIPVEPAEPPENEQEPKPPEGEQPEEPETPEGEQPKPPEGDPVVEEPKAPSGGTS